MTRHLERRNPKVKALIKQGKGRRKLEKVLDGARKDNKLFIAEVDINPRGAVIGKFIMGIDKTQQLNAIKKIEDDFSALIDSSTQQVARVISEESNRSNTQLSQALDAVKANNAQIQREIVSTVNKTSSELVGKLTVVMIVLGIALLVALALIMINRVLSKVKTLTAALEDLAKGGDLTQKINISSKDEIGDMATSVNEFLAKTRELILEANKAADNTSSRVEAMITTTDEVNHAVSRQKDEINLVSNAMNEVVKAIEEESASIQAALQNVDSVKAASENNSVIAQQMKKLIGELVEQVQQANDRVKQFEDLSGQIGSVLDVIQGIAEQTNLLALNAAIEAARAGDSGRGFAVVADEVRALASKTHQSTEEIQRNIERLQSGSKGLVEVIENVYGKAQQGIDEISRSDELQEDIRQSIQTIYDMINTIAAMAEEQTAVANEVSASTERINQESEQSIQAVEQANRVARS